MHVRLKSNGAGYWQAFCASGFPNGQKTLTIASRLILSRRGALERCRELEHELRCGSFASSAPRLSEWLTRCEHQRTGLSAGTRRVNRFAGQYLKRFFSADPPIDRITREQAASWRAALADGTLSAQNKWHKSAPAEPTVCKYVRSVRAIFAVADDQELIDANPFDRLCGTARPPAKNWSYLDATAMRAIFDACPNLDWQMLFGLCRYGGLRWGEAVTLRWPDVNFARNQMLVNATARIDNKHRPRVVPIEPARCPSGLTTLLYRGLENADDGALRVCESIRPGHPPHKRAASIVATAAIPRYARPFHTLRKNCATDWASRYPQHVVSEWLGHSITVAGEFYQRVPQELYAAPDGLAQNDQNGAMPFRKS